MSCPECERLRAERDLWKSKCSSCAWCLGNLEAGDHSEDCPVKRLGRMEAEVTKWRDAAIDACAKVGSLRALCREAADFINCEGNDDLYDRLLKEGGQTP